MKISLCLTDPLIDENLYNGGYFLGIHPVNESECVFCRPGAISIPFVNAFLQIEEFWKELYGTEFPGMDMFTKDRLRHGQESVKSVKFDKAYFGLGTLTSAPNSFPGLYKMLFENCLFDQTIETVPVAKNVDDLFLVLRFASGPVLDFYSTLIWNTELDTALDSSGSMPVTCYMYWAFPVKPNSKHEEIVLPNMEGFEDDDFIHPDAFFPGNMETPDTLVETFVTVAKRIPTIEEINSAYDREVVALKARLDHALVVEDLTGKLLDAKTQYKAECDQAIANWDKTNKMAIDPNRPANAGSNDMAREAFNRVEFSDLYDKIVLLEAELKKFKVEILKSDLELELSKLDIDRIKLCVQLLSN